MYHIFVQYPDDLQTIFRYNGSIHWKATDSVTTAVGKSVSKTGSTYVRTSYDVQRLSETALMMFR